MTNNKNNEGKKSNLLPISILALSAAIVVAPLIYRSLGKPTSVTPETVSTSVQAPAIQAAAPVTAGFVEGLPMVDEANLSPEKKSWVIQKANQEQCACHCGHNIASCVKGDPTCPERPKNIARIRQLIQEAARVQGT